MLQKYGIATLEHKFILIDSNFVHKIFKSSSAPSLLSEKLKLNKEQKNRPQNSNNIIEPNFKNNSWSSNNSYFFSKLINYIFKDTINIKFEDLKIRTFNNINNIIL